MNDFEDATLKTLSALHKGQKQLQDSVRRLEGLHEKTTEKIDQIIEVVSPALEKSNEHTDTLEDH